MQLFIYCGLTNVTVAEAGASYEVPLGRSEWNLVPPLTVVTYSGSSSVFTAETARGEIKVGNSLSGAVVASAEYPSSVECVLIGLSTMVAWWLMGYIGNRLPRFIAKGGEDIDL